MASLEGVDPDALSSRQVTKIPLSCVDAFAERPFSGNPAAVCLLEEPASDEWMQRVAQELNLSETAFVTPGDSAFGLRWFTPAFEVDLCGHATLAAAHTLWEAGRVESGRPIRFSTRSGILTVEQGGGWLRMDFPSDPPRPERLPEGLAEALGVTPVWFGRGRSYEFAVVESEAVLGGIEPDFRALAALSPVGICVTATGTGVHDFVSRFFAPSAGVDEDPVTGSAHCLLAPYWAGELGRTSMLGRQISKRGGDVRVELAGERVIVAGKAVTVSRGELVAFERATG